jgi:hypothetical protein
MHNIVTINNFYRTYKKSKFIVGIGIARIKSICNTWGMKKKFKLLSKIRTIIHCGLKFLNFLFG